MSSSFHPSSHSRHHLHPRPTVLASRSIDRLYASAHQLYCLSIWFANLIQKLGKRLMLRQIPIATATVYFRRFYLKNSYCETNPYLVLAACVFVAAKVEETPVHIKSVVSEAKTVFGEHNIKMFPAEPHKLGEMEFYLMEDLDFHLIVFHPYRSLLAICGREPSDSGKFAQTRLEEDQAIRQKEAEAKKKRAAPGTPGIRAAGVASPGGGFNWNAIGDGEDAEESEEERLRRLMGRGSGEGLMEIDEGVLQISLFILNDTYRTDVHLLYPPHIIALSALYVGFTLSSMTPHTRTRNSSSQLQTLIQSKEINAALQISPPPSGGTATGNAAEFLASFEVNWGLIMACVQDLISLYPIWETFEPSNIRAGGAAGAGAGAGAAAAAAANNNNPTPGGAGRTIFGPADAEALVRKMIEERMVDLNHPDNAGKRDEEVLRGIKRHR